MRVLVVEDDTTIAEPLVTGLRREGYDVERVGTGEEALADDGHDLVLLDLGLPDLDGRVVCRRLRGRSEVPIIVISARSDEIDRVQLLELGADDYLVKPFGFRELVARISAVTRRSRATTVPTGDVGSQDLGDLQIDRRQRKVTVEGDEIQLTPKEFDLLSHLAEDPGAVRTREDILRAVWNENWWGSTRTLDVHVAGLRRKLGRPELIETVRGVGFRLVPEA
ncbi:MAG: response regulator transcription factor [Actinomycetota bacterium]